MTESAQLIEALDARVKRREERRDFFKNALGAVAMTAAGATALSMSSKAAAQAVTDADVLNFALNLEYLEAQFYSYAANGTGLDASLLTGTGTQGTVLGGRKVAFTDPVVQQYAREIAADEVAHVRFLRTALGTSAVSMPTVDVSVGPNTAFSAAARAAGLIGATDSFDPYSTDENFLLGAFIFEDVGVTAYKGASPLITNNTYLDAAAGILAAEAFHAGLIRTVLYSKGIATPTLRTGADAISNARDSLDGTDDRDQGISPMSRALTTTAGATTNVQISNIAPTDSTGQAYSRTTGQVLHIVYLTSAAAAAAGGFFPNGVNGTIRTAS
ncbi:MULTISPECIES: ferritin-like domain-containing protein [unclassified Sphingomonas]|uniref:ferritin-like domain-containing protein n=1 Tax=unclassified Sphingomonas TaxID=196159 RepID=UPI00226B3BED|nr:MULTISPECIES: ferritin-like domain-containing protein [unclassified Sphingomonas]